MHYIAQEVILPSYGKLYDGKLKENGGRVLVSGITLKTEKSLILSNPEKLKLSLILDGATNLNELGFDYRDLLIADVNYLLLAIRALTYGNVADFFVNCLYCAKSVPVKVELESIFNNAKTWKDVDVQEPFDIMLSNFNLKLTMRFLRERDKDEILYNQYKADLKAKEIAELACEAVVRSYAARLVAVNDKSVTYEEAYDVISQLTEPMLSYIDEELEKRACGVETVVEVTCLNCQGVMPIDLTLRPEFFRFSISEGKRIVRRFSQIFRN